MTDFTAPEFPHLPGEAVDLLTAIRDHLDIPYPAQGSKKARRSWADKVGVRAGDVLDFLNDLLAVPLPDVAACAEDLRTAATEEDRLWSEMEAGQ